MPRDYSAAAKTAIYSTGTASEDKPVLLLEIDHPDLAEPVRVVQDTQDFPHQGNTFQALAFEAAPPDDPDKGEPRAQLVIDNIGRELVQWLEASRGGEGATGRFIQARRSDPDTIEWEVTLDLENTDLDPLHVSADLMFDTLVNKVGIAHRFTPETAPAMF